MTTEEILRSNLTDDQYDTVLDESKHILCLACAGSGKSRTLAYKIAYLISKGEKPESIVAFTFTEKAADSIKRRVAEALRKFDLPENYIGAMFIGTLDSFCQNLLGNIDAKYRQYDILDENGLFLFVLSRFYRLGLRHQVGTWSFNTIKSLTAAWQTINNENLSLADVEKYDYTAITRAERVLYLTGSEVHPGLARRKRPSEFTVNLKNPAMRIDKDFDDLADKMEEIPRVDNRDFPTDYSSVKTYLTCPYAYKLSTVFGYNAAVPELFGFGKTTHTILERLHQRFPDRAPTAEEVMEIVESTFMLKHVFPSADPINRPGSYERAKALVQRILKQMDLLHIWHSADCDVPLCHPPLYSLNAATNERYTNFGNKRHN